MNTVMIKIGNTESRIEKMMIFVRIDLWEGI